MGMSAIPAETYARILNGEAVVDGPASARPGGQMRQMRACRPRSGKFAGVALALAPLALAFFAGRRASVSQHRRLPRLHRPRPRRATPPSDVSSALAGRA